MGNPQIEHPPGEGSSEGVEYLGSSKTDKVKHPGGEWIDCYMIYKVQGEKKKMIAPSDYTPKNNPPTDESLSSQLRVESCDCDKNERNEKGNDRLPLRRRVALNMYYVCTSKNRKP